MNAPVRHLLRTDASGRQHWVTAAWLAAGAESFTVAAGRPLLVEGDPSNDVYLVMDGTAAVVDVAGSVHLVRAGDLAGALEPVLSLPRMATVECVTDCEVARLDGARFSQAWEICPRLRSVSERSAPATVMPPRPSLRELQLVIGSALDGCQRTVAALRNQSTTLMTNAWSRSSWASKR